MIRRSAAALLLTGLLVGCSATAAAPTEFPIGGLREPITRQNLADVQREFPGEFLQAGWLPAGFELVNVEYVESANRIESVDLQYAFGDASLHIWQSELPDEDLATKDPVATGDPISIGGVNWHANALPATQAGRAGVIAFSARMADGHSISIDGNLGADVMKHVLESLR